MPSRAFRSKLALAIVACLLLATFTPISWFRSWLPRGSSPATSLGEWAYCRGELSQLRSNYFLNELDAIEVMLLPEEVVIGYPDEEKWERISKSKRQGGTTPASSQFDDLFVDPPSQTDSPVFEPFQAAD